jgi:hypothetical protein
MKSAEAPAMNLVTPGDPTHSYLMHKMDGDQATLASQCVGSEYESAYPQCGMLMPRTSTAPLPGELRETIRSWILQGALDN